jgi:hypothetical protein
MLPFTFPARPSSMRWLATMSPVHNPLNLGHGNSDVCIDCSTRSDNQSCRFGDVTRPEKMTIDAQKRFE